MVSGTWETTGLPDLSFLGRDPDPVQKRTEHSPPSVEFFVDWKTVQKRIADFLAVFAVMEKLWFGDWFLLMQLCKNMNPSIFHDLVIDLRDRWDTLSYSIPKWA